MEEKIQFSIEAAVKDMYAFLLRHFYTGVNGAVDILFIVGLLLLAFFTRNTVPASYTALYVVIAIIFVCYPFVSLRRRAKMQAASPQLQGELTYEVDDKGIAVVRGEERAEITWDELKKVVETKRLLIVYVNSARAFVWPKEQIGELYGSVAVLMQKKLHPAQNKLKSKLS